MFAFFRKFKQILRESLRGFINDKCYLHASSLTFYTLLSIVPILAIVFGLAKGFGFERNIEQELYQRLSEHREVVNIVLDFARSLLQQAEGSYITGIGVTFLFLFVISLFWTIEASLNDIWKVKRSRPFFRIITDYLAMMIICPFFFVIASSLTVLVSSQISEVVEQHAALKPIAPFLFFAYRGITLLMIWILFTSLYLIMPNTRVPARYAFSAGVLAGTVYYVVLIAVIKFQIGVSQYSAIYGSFAALPLFLFWLQISWLIVLLGAEFAYHAEHLSPTLNEARKRKEISSQLLSILLAYKIVLAFKKGDKQWSLNALSQELGIPEDAVQNALNPLIATDMMMEFKSDNNTLYYQPARDLEMVTLHAIMHVSNPLVYQKVMVNDCDELDLLSKNVKAHEIDCNELKSNIPIYKLAKVT